MILLTAEQSMSRLFDLDMQLIADATLMIIAVFVLFLAMSFFLFEPAKKVLKNRQEKIKNELDEAQSSMEQAKVAMVAAAVRLTLRMATLVMDSMPKYAANRKTYSNA